MLTAKIKREHLKSFTHRAQDDRATPRLRHDNAPAWNHKWNTPDDPQPKTQSKPQSKSQPIGLSVSGSNSWRDYIAQDHKPKIVFDSRFAGKAAYEFNDSGFVVPELDPEIDGKNKCRYCEAEFVGRKRCRNHMWSKHKQQVRSELIKSYNECVRS